MTGDPQRAYRERRAPKSCLSDMEGVEWVSRGVESVSVIVDERCVKVKYEHDERHVKYGYMRGATPRKTSARRRGRGVLPNRKIFRDILTCVYDLCFLTSGFWCGILSQ